MFEDMGLGMGLESGPELDRFFPDSSTKRCVALFVKHELGVSHTIAASEPCV